MIIDFHTHIFPEKIAASAISSLEKRTPGVTAKTNGTLDGLLNSMAENNIDISVVQPVVTAPHQFQSINDFAAAHNSGKLVYFGGIHPECEDLEAKLDSIKALGLRGIKLHPDYQSTFINDDRYIRILRHALKIGLYVTIHAGVDIGLPNPVHCPPVLAAEMLDAVDDLNRKEPRIILAHFGGHDMAADVLKYLCGKNVMFDTAFSALTLSHEKIKEIIEAHGAEKVLFASDSPWAGQGACADIIRSLDLSEEKKELILCGNAQRILNL